MLEIYRTTSILKNYPLDIECMHAYGDHLLVGTKQGNLLLFKLILKPIKGKVVNNFIFNCND